MKNKIKLFVLIVMFAIPVVLSSPFEANTTIEQAIAVASTTPTISEQQGPVLSHQQDVWRSVLEWCESRGNHEAINAVDLDGTPSYYSFQFKPGTFRGYGEQYGVIKKGLTQTELMEALKSYELQKKIVGYMILDPKINWHQQFPACVRMHGLPPRS